MSASWLQAEQATQRNIRFRAGVSNAKVSRGLSFRFRRHSEQRRTSTGSARSLTAHRVISLRRKKIPDSISRSFNLGLPGPAAGATGLLAIHGR